MDVDSQPDVVRQIPADVIGIFIDDNFVGIPKPSIAVSNVIGRDGKIESTKPESIWTTAREAPHMATAESAGEVPMLPRMIEVVMNIVTAGLVADPSLAAVYVGSVGVARFFAERPVFLSWRCMLDTRWTVSWDVLMSAADFWSGRMAIFLRQG